MKCNHQRFCEADKIGSEVLQFVKEALNLRINHPFPLRFKGLTSSCLAYGQAIYQERLYKFGYTYYTKNSYFLKLASKLKERFGTPIDHENNLVTDYNEVCELGIGNAQKKV